MGVSRIPGDIRIDIGPRRRKPSPFPPRPAPAACPRGFPFYNWWGLYHSPNAKVLAPPSLKEMVANFASKTAHRHEKKIVR